MVCPKCGKNNKDIYKFCAKCGAKLEIPMERPEIFNRPPVENMVKELDLDSFENEDTMDFDDIAAFENDETVMLDDFSAFENDETVILDDVSAFENDETAVLIDESSFENDETVILDEQDAPSFPFRSVYKEEAAPPAAPPSAAPAKDDMAYIEHLRRLKELLDDGIITEDEFKRKKEQILGI